MYGCMFVCMWHRSHVTLDRNPDRDTLLYYPGDLYSTCPYRKFHTLTSLLHSRVAVLPNSHPAPCQAGRQFVPIL